MAQAYIDKNNNLPGMAAVRRELKESQELSNKNIMERLFKSEQELRQNKAVLFPDFSLLDK